MQFATKAVHGGQRADKETGAVIIPLHPSTTFAFNEISNHNGYEYARVSNPTRVALETCIAELENGKFGIAFASGLAAEHAILSLLKSGDHIISSEDIYGGTYRLYSEILEPLNIKTTLVNFADEDEIERAFTADTKMIWLETPTNPTLKVYDIRKAADIAHKFGAILVVDNTFVSPYFQKPLDLGADVVIHSTTKYINGHSDVIGGLVVLNDEKLHNRLKIVQKTVGAVPGPFDAWLTLRGVKTLPLRMKQHQENAFAVARFLEMHPNVDAVFYPGLESHPDHETAKNQMTGFGGVVSFRIKGGKEAANQFFIKLKLFYLADSLGGVESLANHSASMTHDGLTEEQRQKAGITDNLIRLSIGIEDINDIVEDLKQALEH